MVILGWIDQWRSGDISTAFLQGKDRGEKSRGRLYLEPPARPLDGASRGALLEVKKSIYGLPDAPRAWWEELTGYLTSLGYQHTRMDAAFLVWYHENGALGSIIVVHVDDLMITGDGIEVTETLIEKQVHKKFPLACGPR